MTRPTKHFAEKIGEKYYCYIDIIGALEHLSEGLLVSNTEFITADYSEALIDCSGYNDDGKLLDAFSTRMRRNRIALETSESRSQRISIPNFLFEIPEPVVKPLKNKIMCYS